MASLLAQRSTGGRRGARGGAVVQEDHVAEVVDLADEGVPGDAIQGAIIVLPEAARVLDAVVFPNPSPVSGRGQDLAYGILRRQKETTLPSPSLSRIVST